MNNIILIGFMGCGKTSVGIRLSYKVKMTFFDTDKLIENKEKTSITEIFATKGEAEFRNMENLCIKDLLKEKSNHVISVGGGLPIQEQNRALLQELGTVIYLKANVDTIYERVKHDTARPLLQGEDPKGKIAELLAKRENIYETVADYIVVVDGKNFGEILGEIVDLVPQ
ncbi:MAG: shikimate kinase [Eubacteriales bacterium]